MRFLDKVLAVITASALVCLAPPVFAQAPDPLKPGVEFVFEEIVTLGSGFNLAATPLGRYQWLNKATFVNRLDIITHEGKPAVRIRFYRIR